MNIALKAPKIRPRPLKHGRKAPYSKHNKAPPVTVCIAAISNAGLNQRPIILAAADRMITIGDIEFEPEQTKAFYLASHTLVLMAGEMHLHAHAIPRVLGAIKNHSSGPLLVQEIADYYAMEFAVYRRTLAERSILTPLGITMDTLPQKQREMSDHIAELINQELQLSQIKAQAIIAGLDPTGPHIYVVSDPGVSRSFDTESFAVSGLGEELARPQLMLAGYHRRWNAVDAAMLIYSAKRRAEMVSSVGPQTDMFIIADGLTPPIYQLNPSDHKEVGKIFKRQLQREKRSQQQSSRDLAKYIQKLGTGHQAGGMPTPQQPPTQQPSSDTTTPN